MMMMMMMRKMSRSRMVMKMMIMMMRKMSKSRTRVNKAPLMSALNLLSNSDLILNPP